MHEEAAVGWVFKEIHAHGYLVPSFPTSSENAWGVDLSLHFYNDGV